MDFKQNPMKKYKIQTGAQVSIINSEVGTEWKQTILSRTQVMMQNISENKQFYRAPKWLSKKQEKPSEKG